MNNIESCDTSASTSIQYSEFRDRLEIDWTTLRASWAFCQSTSVSALRVSLKVLCELHRSFEKGGKLFLDNASAASFQIPDMCSADKAMLNFAHINNRHRVGNIAISLPHMAQETTGK